MPGVTFLPGEQKTRPGVYVRVSTSDIPQFGVQGIVAALLRSSWGPLNTPTRLSALDQVARTFGTGGTVAAAQEAFRGGAREVLAYRLGTGGTAASATLNDTGAPGVAAVTITAKYPGTRGSSLKVSVRDALVDTSLRELLVYEETTLRETIPFAKGATGDGEPAALVAAAADSQWITAAKVADGTKLLAAANLTPLAGGADPTVNGDDYSDGLSAVESLDWNVLAVDSEDTAVHATVQAYVDRVRGEGKRVLAVLGEPTSVALATRFSDAQAFADPAIVYVGNGFKRSDGTTCEGYAAAARVAGMIAAAPLTASLTHALVAGATEVVGALTNGEIEQAIRSGALVFSVSSQRQVQIEYGITTFTQPNLDFDAGWKKIRRVRTRDYLMDQIAARWEVLVGRVNNDADGRATLVAAAQGIINQLVAQGALLAGTIVEDPANPPTGDSAWFVVQVDDVDSAEKLYLAFSYRFAGPSTST